MSNFIQRLEKLQQMKDSLNSEKQKLEISIQMQEEQLTLLKQQIADKGIDLNGISDLGQEIKDRELSLENKISAMERIIQQSSTEEQQALEQSSDGMTLSLDM